MGWEGPLEAQPRPAPGGLTPHLLLENGAFGSLARPATINLGAKQHAVDGARRVVDLATKIAGASSCIARTNSSGYIAMFVPVRFIRRIPMQRII